MKRILNAAILMALVFLMPLSAHAEQLLVPVGEIVGLHIKDDTVTVAAFDDALGAAARDAGLKIGDQLIEIQGETISSAEDIKNALQDAPESVFLTVARGGKRRTLELKPQDDKTGKKLGVYLRQGISGIGTVTWYDPDSGRFGTLGHGVNSRQGMLLHLSEGSIYEAQISSVTPGKQGQPGLLKGNTGEDQEIGKLYRNTPQGVFGKTKKDFKGQVLPVASFQEIHTGSASIRSTVSGSDPQEYSVEILKIYPQDREDCRNFLLKVTDPKLLSVTGGIVQGMSGSPVIQDGRIVGAVTHVLVNDPTVGYGIFIENMLKAAA